MRRVARRLLVAHADVGDARPLRFRREALHGKADDAENVVDPLLLETARHQLRAVDCLPCVSPIGLKSSCLTYPRPSLRSKLDTRPAKVVDGASGHGPFFGHCADAQETMVVADAVRNQTHWSFV